MDKNETGFWRRPTARLSMTAYRLNGNGPNTGPAMILKVMAGDKITMGTYYYYVASTATGPTPLTPQNLLNSLASGLESLSSVAGEGASTLGNTASSPLLAALTSSISNEDVPGTSKPQAYLNWVLLDNQFNLVANPTTGGNYQNYAMQVGSSGLNGSALQTPLAYTMTATKSGYLYIYLSNTTPGWNVFFDNLSVLHYSSPLIEENHYCPFGLGMAGISDEAIKSQYAENKYRFNKSSELQNKEFADGSGLEVYETKLRTLDPQLGRWWQIDPKTDEAYESVSPYAAMNNDPAKLNDPNGDVPCCELTTLVFQMTQQIVENSDPEVIAPSAELIDTTLTAIAFAVDVTSSMQNNVPTLPTTAAPTAQGSITGPATKPVIFILPKDVGAPAATDHLAPPKAMQATKSLVSNAVNAHGQQKQSTGSKKKSGDNHMRQYKNNKKGNNKNPNQRRGAEDRKNKAKPID